jgi:hypothetical protein
MTSTKADLRKNIKAFEKIEASLLVEQAGKVVLLHQGKLAGIFDTKEAAFAVAADRYPDGRFAVSPPIGTPPATLGAIGAHVTPVSV